jgi:hypothetical protein
MAPVISKISGYVAQVKVKDNQFVKKEIHWLFWITEIRKWLLNRLRQHYQQLKAISLMQKLPQRQLQKHQFFRSSSSYSKCTDRSSKSKCLENFSGFKKIC